LKSHTGNDTSVCFQYWYSVFYLGIPTCSGYDSGKSGGSFFCKEKVCLDSILAKAIKIGIVLSIEDMNKKKTFVLKIGLRRLPERLFYK
jgi:hypothetical protein